MGKPKGGGHRTERMRFAKQWALDEEATSLLLGLDGHAAVEAMAKFAPREDTRDFSAVFKAFAGNFGSSDVHGWGLEKEVR